MAPADVELANRFRAALEAAATTGDRSAVYPFLAEDVEWVAPQRTLHGLDEVKQNMLWGYPPERLDLEFQAGDWEDLGEGRVACDVHQVYRMKKTGEFAYKRDRRIELTIRNEKISRYETQIFDEPA